VPRDVGCHGNGLRDASTALIPGEESAEGIGGPPRADRRPARRAGGTARCWPEALHLPSRSGGPSQTEGVTRRLEHLEGILRSPTTIRSSSLTAATGPPYT